MAGSDSAFDQQVVVVTGAGSGIGRASARLFAARGASVVVADLDLDSAAATAEQIGAAATALRVDVTEPDSVAAAFTQVESDLGRLDVLHSNAGISQPATPIEQTSLETWNRALAVNLTGSFLCARAAIPALKRSGGGAIVFTSSIITVRPRPGLSSYAASKGGVDALVRSLAMELAAEGIRVNGVAPSVVRTPILETFGADDGEKLQQLVASLPIGRALEPEEIAAAVVFMASAEASAATGMIFNADGGRGL
jgi:3-oxoacyl-[acyl-carrier protein] reductase